MTRHQLRVTRAGNCLMRHDSALVEFGLFGVCVMYDAMWFFALAVAVLHLARWYEREKDALT